MPTSTLPAILDALVASFTATFTPLEVPVFDGPELTESNPNQFVGVGYDGDPTAADDQAATFVQSWAQLGGRHAKDEQVEIVCCVCVLNADTVRAARLAAYALFSAIETDLRADPFLQACGITWAEISAGSWHPLATEAGMGGRLVFTVQATARI